MREYKLVHVNKGMRLSREKDIEVAESVINEYAREGWILQQIVSPSDISGVLIAVMYKEK